MDRGVRLMDINGDGILDIVQGPTALARARGINDAVVPDLLSTVTGLLGGTQTFEYLSSAQQGNRLLDKPVQTVSRMTMGGVAVPTIAMTFEYGGGFIDDTDREFRRFAEVIATNGAGGGLDGTILSLVNASDQAEGLVFARRRDGASQMHPKPALDSRKILK